MKEKRMKAYNLSNCNGRQQQEERKKGTTENNKMAVVSSYQ
jgi:hypothetical protein